MNQDTIAKIQKQIIQLLPANFQKTPGILLTDSCSEVSRLVANWIKKLDDSNQIAILKGVGVCKTKKSHDILAVINNNNQIYVIDPTVWQFFTQAKSILIFNTNDLRLAIEKIKKIYGGQWSKNEDFTILSKDEEKEFLEIISKNIIENLKIN